MPPVEQPVHIRYEAELTRNRLARYARVVGRRPVAQDMSELDMPEHAEQPPQIVEVVAIFGPTASGKTAVAEAVADLLGTEVVSCDSMQVYRELPLLTNHPRRPTRLVGIRGVHEQMSVAEYAGLAHTAIDDLVRSTGVAVVAGGTGLYLRAALAHLSIPPAVEPEARVRWESRYDADPARAHELHAELDPAAAAAIHVNDRRRVVRALEVAEVGASMAAETSELWGRTTRRPAMLVGLDVPPDELERRIRARTRAMFEAGVVAEVANALAGAPSKTADKALGLAEIATLDPETAEARIVVRTRRYAAYQRKWMRKLPGIRILDGTLPSAELAVDIAQRARTRSRDLPVADVTRCGLS
jgi:tRNA dimethylallyltransferase